jgi:hypothetical protein
MATHNTCEIIRKKTEDFPGEEWFVYFCRTHNLEVSAEWIERHHGPSEPAPEPHCDGMRFECQARDEPPAPPQDPSAVQQFQER